MDVEKEKERMSINLNVQYNFKNRLDVIGKDRPVQIEQILFDVGRF